MKKLLLIAILMLALVFTVAACKTEPTTNETTAGETTAAPAPVVTTAEPADETTAAAPEETTVAPVETTEAPVETTEAPVETTEEPEETTADPADPVWIIDAEGLSAMSGANNATGELKEGYVSLTATGGDPYFYPVAPNGNIGAMPEYLVISYRTNTTQMGEFFTGNGAGPEGGKSFSFEYNSNGEWNLLVFHLPTVASWMTDSTIGHIRYDFYTGGAEDGAFLDVEFIAFFNTAEYAEAYHFAKHPAYVEKEAAGMVAHSFDTFFWNDEMYFEADGGAGDKLTAQNNLVSFGIDQDVISISLRGWIGFSQAIDSFGYYIDNPYTQIFGEFKQETEAGVLAAGGENASRFKIDADLTGLARGTHKVGFLVKLADGTVVRLREEITVVIPTNYDNYNVPQDQWTITGHNTALNGADNGMVAAGGVESAALLHQGSIYLGEVDLSKYSKVVIMWGCDNSQVTIDHYNASANNRWMLLNAVMDNVMSPEESTIIASTGYELMGWAVTAIEIDLTGIDYNGPVYVAVDALPGTFALVSSVEFIGAELPSEEPAPEEPAVEDIVIDPRTLAAGSITGHMPNIVDSSIASHFPMVAAAGLESCAMIHAGSIYVGEIDLSKYAKVVIYYGTDWGEGTQASLADAKANGFGCIGVSAFDCNNVVNPDRSGFIGSQYTPDGGWVITAHEVDLTGVEYSGPVYVSADFLGGQFILIDRVEFIAAE